ncbi:MAG: hypothetical protein K0R18_511 [Bacillales bacterium]|jgi:hypothetical protein|nr:hypothetical protein [Bacillales bacterium]
MKFNHCPICEKELLYERSGMVGTICINGCYETEDFGLFVNHCLMSPDLKKVKIIIFRGYTSDETNKKEEQIFKDIVAYWKENDRYLIRILGDTR